MNGYSEILNRLVPDQLKIEIVNRIRQAADNYRRTNGILGSHIKVYAPQAQRWTVNQAIHEAFRPDDCIEGLHVCSFEYGRGHVQPVMQNARVKMLILGSTRDMEADYLRCFFELNANFDIDDQHFVYIDCRTRKIGIDRIVSISLVLPSSMRTTLVKRVLYGHGQDSEYRTLFR